jgi:hypothetical protein
VEVHLEVAHHLLLTLLQAALRSIRIEGANEVRVGELQLMKEEGGVDRLAVDSPPGRDVRFMELDE